MMRASTLDNLCLEAQMFYARLLQARRFWRWVAQRITDNPRGAYELVPGLWIR